MKYSDTKQGHEDDERPQAPHESRGRERSDDDDGDVEAEKGCRHRGAPPELAASDDEARKETARARRDGSRGGRKAKERADAPRC
jgi:hypothetical protein